MDRQIGKGRLFTFLFQLLGKNREMTKCSGGCDFRMPKKDLHVLTGVLQLTPQGLYALDMPGGGVWRLDLGWSWRARRLVGRRARVEGIRSDFDLIDVKRIRAADELDSPGSITAV